MIEILDWMRFAMRAMVMLPFLVFLLGALIIAIQFTYRFVEFLSNSIFASPW